MKAAVLSIGTELTRGELVDTNAAWLADRLTNLGFEVCEMASAPDDVDAIVDALHRLSGRYRALVATGGLGPTTDDLTTLAVAKAAGVSLFRHEPSLDSIRRRFERMGREMSSTNAKQADFPEGAEPLPNAVGTAPGFTLPLGECRCFFFPGVPSEMEHLFEAHAQPRLAPLGARDSHQIRLRLVGLPESEVGERLEGVEGAFPGVVLGYRASFPEIEVKIAVRATNGVSAEARALEAAAEVRARLGDAVFGEGVEPYPAHVGRLLRNRGLRVALAESCTGGLVGAMMTDIPGSSDYLVLDAVTYSNAAKSSVLGVGAELLRAYGAVSSECAAAMADGARRVADADIAVSITGIAGPGGGSDDKPVGTVWMGMARRDRSTETTLHRFAGSRDRIRKLSAYAALRSLALAAAD